MPRKTANDVAHDLKNHETQCAERWTTAFKHFEKLDDDIAGLNNWIKGGLTTIVISMLLLLLKDYII
jgi:hypothetical protein